MATAPPVTLEVPGPVHLDDGISMKEGRPAALAQALAICRKALPGWQAVQMDDVEFSTVSGGISNINARLSPKASLGLAPVMVKVFGDKTEQIIDREAEKVVVVALGMHGFGPKVYALFANGRVEQWLDCAGITPQDMCSEAFVPRIARKLAVFHRLQVDLPREPNTPWGVIAGWLAQAKQLQFSDPAKKAAYEAVDFAQLENEVREAQAVCALTHSPVVFGHNDLLSGNILVLQQPGFDPACPDMAGPIAFIDYEYGAYTYRGFDVGNHFTEYAGFEGDYGRYPTMQQQELFFRHYLAAAAAADAAADGSSSSSVTQPQQPQQQPAEPPPLEPGQLERLSAEANAWALASHLYWGIWALIQACNSPIDFDYMGFSATRLGEFRRRKEAWWADARRVFGAAAGTN